MKHLFIFDMDGVLVDSESMYRSMNKEFLQSRGYLISDMQYDGYIGIHAHTMWADLKDKANLQESVKELIEWEKKAKTDLLSHGELRPVSGVHDLLDILWSKGINMAVASSSLRTNVDIVLSRLNIRHFFKHSVSGDEVIKGKPDPEIFLKAADLFGIATEDAVVIEDSANGVLAAKRAGMYAIGYQAEASGNQDLTKADLVINDLAEITRAMFPS